MQVIKQETVHVGYGVKVKVVDGRLRITVPCNKRWRMGMFITLYIGLIFILNPLVIFTIGWSGRLNISEISNMPIASILFYLASFGLWLIVTGLFIWAVLWFLRGQYVLEIGDKKLRVGRSLFGSDFLSTHEVAGLRRLRFAPALKLDNGSERSIGMKWQPTGGQVFQPGRYNLHLDYGSKQPEVLHMAIEEEQVRAIKEIIHSHYPHLYHSSQEFQIPATLADPHKEIEVVKSQIK